MQQLLRDAKFELNKNVKYEIVEVVEQNCRIEKWGWHV